VHHILFAVALDLGLKNVDYIKLSNAPRVPVEQLKTIKKDNNKTQVATNISTKTGGFLMGEGVVFPQIPAMLASTETQTADKSAKSAKSKKTGKEPSNTIAEQIMLTPPRPIGTGPLVTDSYFLNDESSANNFAELLPDTEVANTDADEGQGPKFLDSIKNRLITMTGKEEKKSLQKQEIDRNSDTLGNVKGKVIAGTSKVKDMVLNSDLVNASGTTDTNLISFENKSKRIEDNITTARAAKKKADMEYPQLPIVGTLFDSELQQALNTKKNIIVTKKTFASADGIINAKQIEYKEDEDYIKFLSDKEFKDTTPEIDPLLVTNIVPREKQITNYRNNDVPDELLASRSFQNRHIPKITTTQDMELALESVIKYGMLSELRAFMDDLRDADLTMANQYTLLTVATKHRQYDVMKYLIHVGANLNKRDDRLDTPLLVAVRNNDINAARILLASNANPDIYDVLKRTPLIYAIEKGYDDVALYLIDSGADINITNSVGEGTLSLAFRLERKSVQNKLLDILKNSSTTVAEN